MEDVDAMIEAEVGVDDLARYGNPLDGGEWDCLPITAENVLERLASGDVETESWQVVNARHRAQAFNDHGYHIGRVAYLLANLDRSPLEVEIEGIKDAYGDYRRVRIYDGNHRLAAAILRNDGTIRISVRDWELEAIREFLPSLRVTETIPVPALPC